MSLAGRSALGSQIGYGPSLQIWRGDAVQIETDTSNVGLQNCPNTAADLIRSNPKLTGQVKCAGSKTDQPLPYGFKSLKPQSTAADEKLPSSAATTRTRTAALCANMLASVRQKEKTLIVEEHCA